MFYCSRHHSIILQIRVWQLLAPDIASEFWDADEASADDERPRYFDSSLVNAGMNETASKARYHIVRRLSVHTHWSAKPIKSSECPETWAFTVSVCWQVCVFEPLTML